MPSNRESHSLKLHQICFCRAFAPSLPRPSQLSSSPSFFPPPAHTCKSLPAHSRCPHHPYRTPIPGPKAHPGRGATTMQSCANTHRVARMAAAPPPSHPEQHQPCKPHLVGCLLNVVDVVHDRRQIPPPPSSYSSPHSFSSSTFCLPSGGQPVFRTASSRSQLQPNPKPIRIFILQQRLWQSISGAVVVIDDHDGNKGNQSPADD